eukprot:COSAG01_NODE_16855_length_1198_cov_6.101001_1_plen_277_part_00
MPDDGCARAPSGVGKGVRLTALEEEEDAASGRASGRIGVQSTDPEVAAANIGEPPLGGDCCSATACAAGEHGFFVELGAGDPPMIIPLQLTTAPAVSAVTGGGAHDWSQPQPSEQSAEGVPLPSCRGVGAAPVSVGRLPLTWLASVPAVAFCSALASKPPIPISSRVASPPSGKPRPSALPIPGTTASCRCMSATCFLRRSLIADRAATGRRPRTFLAASSSQSPPCAALVWGEQHAHCMPSIRPCRSGKSFRRARRKLFGCDASIMSPLSGHMRQ